MMRLFLFFLLVIGLIAQTGGDSSTVTSTGSPCVTDGGMLFCKGYIKPEYAPINKPGVLINLRGVLNVSKGPAHHATALAIDGSNCGAGLFPKGIDASGNSQGCVPAANGGTGISTSASAGVPRVTPRTRIVANGKGKGKP
jgi:hypothetical protein